MTAVHPPDEAEHMTTHPTALGPLQRWFQAAITHPDGVRQGVASGSARRHIDLGPDDVARVLTGSVAQSPLDRLAVYGHAYFARLLDCVREEYPVLKHALGDEAFEAFAAGYLQEHPSRSYTLFALGARFPEFLRVTRPALESDDGQPDWADFLIELAEVELAFNQVFDGPGTEGEPPLGADALAAIPPESLPDCRLVPAPCLRLIELCYPVHTYFAAVRRGEPAVPPDPADTYLAVTRTGFVVRHYELCRPAYRLLRELLAGRRLGDAIAAAVGDDLADPELEARLGEWFHDWAGRGFFRAVLPAPDATSSAA